MRKLTVNVLTHGEFDLLIAENLNLLKPYEFLPYEEVDNYVARLYEDITGKVTDRDEKEILDGTYTWRARILLEMLVREHYLAPGNYLITVFW